MKVRFFNTLTAAQGYERALLLRARALGQVCDRWAEIIVDPVLGYGVPTKDRVSQPADTPNITLWTPPVIERL